MIISTPSLRSQPLGGDAQIGPDDVRAARDRIRDRLHRTPTFGSATLSALTGAGRVGLKAELFQRTGSFKPRGALNKVATLTAHERRAGVISISAGNHAQGLAWAAAAAGVDALLVTWATASATKVAAVRAYGAAVDMQAASPAEAFERLGELHAVSGRTYVHPWDDPLVMAGHGTVGLELLEDVPDAEVVFVPAGGGCLVSGIAIAASGAASPPRIVAVEPENSAALRRGLEAGRPVEITPSSIADGLSAPFAGTLPLEICRRYGVESVLVTDADIEVAMRFLYTRAKLACEPAGAVGVAALLAGKVEYEAGATVAAVVSGGNVDPETAAAILARDEA